MVMLLSCMKLLFLSIALQEILLLRQGICLVLDKLNRKDLLLVIEGFMSRNEGSLEGSFCFICSIFKVTAIYKYARIFST